MVEAEAPNKDQTQKQEKATLQQQSSTLSPLGQPQPENDTTYITDPYNITRIIYVVIIYLALNVVRRGFGETPNATLSTGLKFNVGFAATVDADSATLKTLQELGTRLNMMK
ncbi:MAG: hypothetical protein QXV09_03270 [Candidatus Bathyarchaeia archaeon]